MDAKMYIANAVRTESVIEKAKVEDKLTFLAVLKAFVASATLLDAYKKNIFYNKPVNEEKWMAALNQLVGAGTELKRGYYPGVAKHDTLNIDTRVFHAIIGIATESGELMETVLDKLEVQKALDGVNLQEEVGDLNWYEALLIDALQADWDEIRKRNIAKLRARYPDKFTSENAITRDLDKERQILEGNEPRQCPMCDGRGTEIVTDGHHGHYGFTSTCNRCGGSGVVQI